MGSRGALADVGSSVALSKKPKRKRVGTAGSSETRSVGAAKAKAEFLAIAEEVHTSERSVTITKRGVPFVRVAPLLEQTAAKSILGCMKGTATITGDIVAPEPDLWESLS